MSKVDLLVSALPEGEITTADIDAAADSIEISRNYARNLIRRNFEKVDRATYDITRPLGTESKPKKKKTAAKPAAPVAAPAPVMQAAAAENNVVDIAEARGLKRHSLVADNPVTVPARDPNFVPFGCFKILDKILSTNKFHPVFVSGDTGNGKTLSVEQVCAKHKRPLVMFNVTNETCEEDLIGSETLVDGNLVWADGPVLRAYRTPNAVLLLDELDQGTSRVMCLQTILQGKPYYVKKTGETVYPAEGVTVIATGNTKGLGDESGRFVGAQLMNEAFLERFNMMIAHSYPTKSVEKRILGKLIDEREFTDVLVELAAASRIGFENGQLDVQLTTRRLVQIVQNYEIFEDRLTAVRFGVERFDDVSRDRLIDMYTKLDKNVDPSEIFDTEVDGEDDDSVTF